MSDMDTDIWLTQLLRTIDARNAERFVEFLTPDADFRFGNQPVVHGRDAIRAAVAGFFAAIGGCSHRLLRTWRDESTVAMQGEVTYLRLDGATVTIPFVNVFVMADDQIREYSIYIDNTPLFASP
jgi:ketosteroid isomerase-like protein